MASDAISRIILNYLAQLLFSTIIFFIFRYFSKVYRYHYLKFWSWSWIAFSLQIVMTTIVISMLRSYSNLRFALSFVSQLLAFMQIVFLLFGTYELTAREKIKTAWVWKAIAITAVVALINVSLYAFDPSASMMRSVLRFGVRSFVSGAGFIISAIMIYRNSNNQPGVSQKLLCLSFLLFGLEQLILVISSVATSSIPYDFGLVDLFLISMIGLSMVMWLLEDEREKLSKTNKELDSFLYSASHDLRAPIATVLGLTNLAQLELKDEESKKYFVMIEQRIKKLDTVISDILHLSRSTKAEFKKETIDFNKLLSDVIADVKFNEGAHAIQLRYEPNANNMLNGDYSQMKIILGNLISNAVKYHKVEKPDPFIEVTFSKRPKQITFSVEDNGEGIAPENQKKIFEMFFRASLGSEGTGLGLYIVKEAVNKLHGKVDVYSVPDEGSKFTVTIPQ